LPDTLLLPRYLVPVRPRGEVLQHYAVGIENGVICWLGSHEEALARFPNAERVYLDRHVLLPGLVNMHTHSAMTLLRGYADDLELNTWLREHICRPRGTG